MWTGHKKSLSVKQELYHIVIFQFEVHYPLLVSSSFYLKKTNYFLALLRASDQSDHVDSTTFLKFWEEELEKSNQKGKYQTAEDDVKL